MTIVVLMHALAKSLISRYGLTGQHWLEQAPTLIASIAKTWGLAELTPLPNLTHNYVLSGVKDGKPIILKLSINPDELEQEAMLLNAFADYGAVAVLAEQPGALLLECAIPGTTLKNYFPAQENESINIAAAVIKKLHQAPLAQPEKFKPITTWLNTIHSTAKIPAQYLNKAIILKNHLLSSAAPPVLLHGDLHHDNILQHQDGWVVIDPKGVIGEPAYEVAAFICNPIPELLQHPNAGQLVQHRIITFADILNIPADRIYQWCFVQAVLAWIWNLEDGLDTSYFEQYTSLLETLQNNTIGNTRYNS